MKNKRKAHQRYVRGRTAVDNNNITAATTSTLNADDIDLVSCYLEKLLLDLVILSIKASKRHAQVFILTYCYWL